MKNKIMTILNIFWAMALIATVIAAGAEFIRLSNTISSIQSEQEYAFMGIGFLIIAAGFTFSVFAELSIYFNLRYFLVNKDRSTLKSIFNAIMPIPAVSLLLSIVLMYSGLLWDMYDTWLIPSFAALCSLRLAYLIIKNLPLFSKSGRAL